LKDDVCISQILGLLKKTGRIKTERYYLNFFENFTDAIPSFGSGSEGARGFFRVK
jgi:hypothetical protein